MARIRNIKPDYFRHEALQDLEAAHPGAYIMLTYIALWCQCDANGIFPWRPRTLKLDILPFIPYDLAATLQILLNHQYIKTYTAHDGNTYGHIPTFKTHQRITGKEATEGEKYPKPNQNKPGNNRETTGKQPDAQGEERITGKEIREREGHNAHAHEGQPENQKTATAQTNPETTSAPQPSTGGGGTVTDIYDTINAHCNTDHGLRELITWKKQAGYSDRTHGPTTGEVTKFISKYLDRIRTTDPVQYFRDNFPAWLVRATEYNRPKKDAPTKYQPPPPHQQQRHPPRTNGNAHQTTHIGNIIGKTITEIT